MADLKQFCAHCGGKISFDSSGAGLTVDCPHCGKQTMLHPPQKAKWNVQKMVIAGITAVLAVGILIYGLRAKAARDKYESARREARAIQSEIIKLCNGLTISAMKNELTVISARSEAERILGLREIHLTSDQKYWMKALNINLRLLEDGFQKKRSYQTDFDSHMSSAKHALELAKRLTNSGSTANQAQAQLHIDDSAKSIEQTRQINIQIKQLESENNVSQERLLQLVLKLKECCLLLQ